MNRRLAGILVVLLFNLTAVPAIAQEKNVILAVDMAVLQEGSSASEAAEQGITRLIHENVGSGDSLAILAIGEGAHLLKGFGDDLRKVPELQRMLPPDTGPSSLAAALEAAAALFTAPGGRENLLLLVTAGGDDPGRSVLGHFERLLRQGVRIRFYLPSTAPAPQELASELSSVIEIRTFPPGPPGEGTLARVREHVACEAGIEPEEVSPNGRLAEDFGFDQLKAYELVTEVCEETGAPLPDDSVPTTVAALAEHIDRYRDRRLAGKAFPAPAVNSGLAGVSDQDDAPRYAEKRERKPFLEQTIFYATNRNRTGNGDPSDFFGGGRSERGRLHYGKCVVTIPAGHRKGAVETPFLGLKFLEDSSQHVLLAQVSVMSRDDFFQLVKTNLHAGKIEEGWENDAVVFIHGFNVTFADAAKRTAQMAHDFGFKGAPLMFSWPSDGKLYAYLSDREDVAWSVTHIEEFLNEIVERILPRRIHLVAHSMGNQGLIGALNMLALRRGAEQRPLFENIILAAPDFDAQMFQEQIAPRVRFLAKRWTVYTSDKDAALNVSTKINSAKRLGLPVTPVGGVDVIDATGVEVTPWSVPEFHSYYATKQKVVQDIVQTIKGVAPGMRNLLQKKSGELSFWQLATH